MTKIMGKFHLSSDEDFFLMLANDEIDISAAQLKNLNKNRLSLMSKLLRNPFSSKKSEPKDDNSGNKRKINRKEIYILHPDDEKPNYKFDTCCSPIPGDDVLGFVDDNENVILHKVSCPNAMRLKSSFGSRLVATRWGGKAERFIVTIGIDGIDRQGILEDITNKLSREMHINIRGLNIAARQELFHCDLTVQIDTADRVEEICAGLKKIKDVKFAKRTS